MLILSPSGIKLETRLVNNDYIQFQLRELEMKLAADVGPQNVLHVYSAACLLFILSKAANSCLNL